MEEVGNDTAEGSSAIGDGGQAAVHACLTLMAQVLVPVGFSSIYSFEKMIQ